LAALSYVLLLAVIALGVPLAISLRDRVSAEVRTGAQAQADLIAATAADLLGPADRGALQALVRRAGTSLRGRVLVVNGAGFVLADSAGPAAVGSSYKSRPEIAAALSGRQFQNQRSSRTLGEEILATAVPIVRHGQAVGAYAHHLLDPSTGQPAWTGLVGATAVAGSSLEAETLSKLALLLGPEGAREVLSGLGGVIVHNSGEVEAVGPIELTWLSRAAAGAVA
jgi:hypothetical protein